jgi:predicted transcriptional regulator
VGGEDRQRRKTIEVRKTKPKLDTPFKCYIYCTLPKYPHEDFIATDYPMPQFYGGGKVIGEFTCDRIYKIDKDSTDFLFKAGGLSVYKQAAEEKCGLCVAMTDDELHGYLGHYQGYGWHISDLRIYDQPQELSEFTGLRTFKGGFELREIDRPPQSWCYVEEG